MRILPRSRRGIWLLGGAVWVSACAGLWWALPVVPRAVMRLPERTSMLGLGPDSTSVLVERFASADGPKNGDRVGLEVLQVPSAQTIATLDSCQSRPDVIGTSNDRHIWLIRDSGLTSSRILKLDLAALTSTPLSIDLEKHDHSGSSTYPREYGRCLSPDGKSLALYNTESDALVLWDIANDRVQWSAKGIRLPYEFSGNGASLAGVVKRDSRTDIRILDLATGKPRATLLGPANRSNGQLRLSFDAAYAVAEFLPQLWESSKTETYCWNVATEKLIVREPLSLPRFVGIAMLVGEENAEHRPKLKCLDLATGNCEWAHSALWDDNPISPDGLRILIPDAESKPGVIEQVAARFGIRWPFPADERYTGSVCDTRTGNRIAVVSAKKLGHPYPDFVYLIWAKWSADGRTLAVHEPDGLGTWNLWDIPTRKPLTWFTAGATLLALPIACLARRRVRKLRAVAV